MCVCVCVLQASWKEGKESKHLSSEVIKEDGSSIEEMWSVINLTRHHCQ